MVLSMNKILIGLSALELGRLRMSVGYGTHKKGRPLSPIEVGSLLQKARSEGVSLEECARAVQLDGTGHIGRFLRVLDLPEDIRHLVDWGSGRKFVGFTSAVELAKLEAADDQRAVAEAVLADGLSSKEVRQVVQLRKRSGREIRECVDEVLDMRPKVERRYVFVGSVSAEEVELLGRITQAVRDTILASGIEELGLRNATGRLGPKFFTLVGDEHFDASMRQVGKENIEARLRTHIREAVENGTAGH